MNPNVDISTITVKELLEIQYVSFEKDIIFPEDVTKEKDYYSVYPKEWKSKDGKQRRVYFQDIYFCEKRKSFFWDLGTKIDGSSDKHCRQVLIQLSINRSANDAYRNYRVRLNEEIKNALAVKGVLLTGVWREDNDILIKLGLNEKVNFIKEKTGAIITLAKEIETFRLAATTLWDLDKLVEMKVAMNRDAEAWEKALEELKGKISGIIV